MYGRRLSKTHPRVEAYGTVDELNSALGLARATAQDDWVKDQLFATQKDLVTLMGMLAVAVEDRERYAQSKYPKMESSMLERLDQGVEKIEAQNISFSGWATPGHSLHSASLDVARTVCRRAERRVAFLFESEPQENGVIPYLNRLSDFLWLLARLDETEASSKK
jgi:cob(I)alamin adenosyltransferase